MCRMKGSTSDDKLSELPEHLLNCILCFLPQKEALRTCVLSKSWRHLGSTRSRLEFSRVDDFNGNNKKFKSVVHNTLQRYNHQNLPLHQLVLKMNCFDLPTIPFELKFLHELYLQDCDLRLLVEPNEDNLNLLLKRLRKLTLDKVDISNEYIGTILSRCPSLEYLGISNDPKWSKIVRKTDACDLKHFVWSHDHMILDVTVVEIDVPTLETIRIVRCSTWNLREDSYFPRLKSVYLEQVRLSSESFGFFSSNYMPSLEELKLHLCYGYREFHLSSPSIKRLHITYMTMPFKATIDAPNIVYFKLKALPLPSISFTPTLSEWKSIVDLSFFVYEHNAALTRMLELNEVLKALSRSQITLKIYLDLGCHDHIDEDSTFGGLYNNKPLDVEHLSLRFRFDYSHDSNVPFIFNYLFRVCRPRYIDAFAHGRRELTVILREVLLHETGRSDYFWHQDLEEVSIEIYCDRTSEWCPVDGNSLSESAMPDNRQIRFRLKWIEY